MVLISILIFDNLTYYDLLMHTMHGEETGKKLTIIEYSRPSLRGIFAIFLHLPVTYL